jgi:uncharacterized protein YodC (DUF2158 family)
MSDIKKGDKVILKSGGPLMTIQIIGDYSMNHGIDKGALCVWFDGSKPMEKVFDTDTLEIYNE